MNDVEQNAPEQATAAPSRAPLPLGRLKPIIEAALLATQHPMTVHQLGELFGEEDDVGREQIARALESLADDCTGRGVELKEVASGFRYQVRQDIHPWLSRLWTERPSRYSRALLETLALIAYRQPITRPEIEQIRGVVVSSNIIKTMEERDWIRVVGHRDVPGRPALFGTTRAFLDYFNLKSLDELPPLSEIRDMEDPQLRFEPEPLPARVVKDLPIDPEAEVAADEQDPDAAAEAVSDGDTLPSRQHDEHPTNIASEGSAPAETATELQTPVQDAPETEPTGQQRGQHENPSDEQADISPSGSEAPEAPDTDRPTADEAANPAAADDAAAEKHS